MYIKYLCYITLVSFMTAQLDLKTLHWLPFRASPLHKHQHTCTQIVCRLVHTGHYLLGGSCRWNFTTLYISANSIPIISHSLHREQRVGERSHVPHEWLHVTRDKRERESKWSALTARAPCHMFCSSCWLFSTRGSATTIKCQNKQ